MAVVIPAFNEGDKIARTIRSVPGFVDRIIVVDDGSKDGTGRIAERGRRRGLEVIVHATNRGVGAAIATGYRRALELNTDVVAVMAGDGQMDPADLLQVIAPVLSGNADYVKGNRFAWRGSERIMPPLRRFGNRVMSQITRITSGYSNVCDSQCGYTAMSRALLGRLPLDRVFHGYGYPNDLLARIHSIDARLEQVPVRPVYGPKWRSGIRMWTVIHPIAGVLLRSWMLRILEKAKNFWMRTAERRSLSYSPSRGLAPSAALNRTTTQ